MTELGLGSKLGTVNITVDLQDDIYERIVKEADLLGQDVSNVVNERLRLSYGLQSTSTFTVKPFQAGGFGAGVERKR